MPHSALTRRGSSVTYAPPARSPWRRLYVSALLALLPMLLKVFHALSKRVRAESAYLGPGFSLALTVEGSPARAVVRYGGSRWRRAEEAASVLTIGFRDLDYAYAVFSGGLSLNEALAARLVTTRGPNDAGVAVTYLFTTILRTFFFWRRAYRR